MSSPNNSNNSNLIKNNSRIIGETVFVSLFSLFTFIFSFTFIRPVVRWNAIRL